MNMRSLLDETMADWTRERPDLDLRPMATVLRLGQLMNLALPAIERVLAPHGISLGEFDVLAALRRRGGRTPLTPSTLARVAMVSPAGMTNRLDRLEAAGLVDRRPDPDDRRGSLVTLTKAGRAVADRAVEGLVAAEAAMLEVLRDADRARLDRVLDTLIARLDAPDQPPAGR